MIFRYTILFYDIRLGRNERCTCDVCFGLRSLAEGLKNEGKSSETAAATKALIEHKNRADFKQQHYRTERQNSKHSWIQEDSVKSLKKTVISTPIIANHQEFDGINQIQDEFLYQTCIMHDMRIW